MGRDGAGLKPTAKQEWNPYYIGKEQSLKERKRFRQIQHENRAHSTVNGV